jgi:hypothetical protein
MNWILLMTLHALTIAKRKARPDSIVLALTGSIALLATGCGGSRSAPEVSDASADAAWVESACHPASIDTTGWRRYRLGDLTIQLPPDYVQAGFAPYELGFRGPGGTLRLQLHRNARYHFDGVNVARRGQVWCNGTLGGHRAEVLSWFEPFSFRPRDTRAGELSAAPGYNFAARLEATWGGQDEEKWLYAKVSATRLRDAQRLRDALHTIAALREN